MAKIKVIDPAIKEKSGKVIKGKLSESHAQLESAQDQEPFLHHERSWSLAGCG